MEKLDVEERWPDLFDNLDANQKWSALDALAASWHEGWIPNYDDVKNLTDFVRGTIDTEEYDRRSHKAASRNKALYSK